MAREMTPQERAAALLEKCMKMGWAFNGSYTEGQGHYVLAQALQTTRQEALREAARQTCMYCSGNARGYTLGVAGPNSAGNYTHEVPEDSWAKEGVLCKATSIWSLIYYEDRLTSEGA